MKYFSVFLVLVVWYVPAYSKEFREHPPLDHIHEFHLTSPARTSVRHPLYKNDHHTRLSTLSKHNHALHEPRAEFTLSGYDRDFSLSLELNDGLFADRFVALDGDRVIERGTEHCYYRGHVNGDPNSLLAVSTCGHGIDGFFHFEGQTYVVAPVEKHHGERQLQAAHHQRRISALKKMQGGTTLGPHLLYRMSDISEQYRKENKGTCGVDHSHEAHGHDHHHDHDEHDSGLEHVIDHISGRLKSHVKTEPVNVEQENKQGPRRKLLQTTNVNYVELLLVNDHQQVTNQGNAANATERAKVLANGMNVLYGNPSLSNQLKVVVTLVAVQNWDTASNVRVNGAVPSSSTDISDYLTAFSNWVSANNAGALKNDNAQMVTGFGLSGGVAGVAWVSTMCGRLSSGVDEDSSGSTVWSIETLTHEMGHNFACSHDSNGNTCPQSGFIMAAVGSICGRDGNPRCPNSSQLTWSTCSLNYISSKVQSLLNTPSNCLGNQPTALGSQPVCGDFLVTPPEQCDVALSPAICTGTCTLKAGVQCTSGECCDINNGKFHAAGTPCRTALHQCDLEDVCDGSSATCPTDLYKADGTECDEAGPGSRCYQGSCIGWNEQCATAGTLYRGQSGWTHGNCPDTCGDLLCQRNGGTCQTISSTDDQGNQLNVPVKDRTYGCTPCSNSSVNGCYCDQGSCVAAPASIGCNPPCVTGKGRCANGGVCACNAGWAGADCSQVQPCAVDCEEFGREGCVPTISTSCGNCLPGRSTKSPDVAQLNTPCLLVVPDASYVFTGDGQNPEFAFDNNSFSHWVAPVDATNNVLPGLVVVYDGGFRMKYYTLESSNSLPEEDPTNWVVYGSNDGTTWKEVDTRRGEMWNQRHLTRAFQARKPGKYKSYRFEVSQVRGGAGATGNVQVATLTYYRDTEEGSSHVTAVVATVVTLTFCVFVAVGVMAYMKKKGTSRMFKSRKLDSGASSSVKSSAYKVPASAASPVVSSPALPDRSDVVPAAAAGGTTGSTTANGVTLPAGWVMYYSEDGLPYYYNEATGDSRWDPPQY